MNQYDLNLILNPNLSAEQVQIEKDYVENTLRSAGAEVVGLDDRESNTRLAYPVGKDREGRILFYTIKSGGNPEKDIASTLRLRDHVRRVLVVKDRPEWKTKKA